MNYLPMTPERWKQVDQLLDAALELPADQIAAFLDTACAGDESLRREVEQLLAADERAQSFIESRALDGATQAANADSMISVLSGKGDAESPFSSRELLAERYQLVSKLGKGGMGEVWHAYDIRLRVDVALKSLRVDLRKNPATAEMLRKEVRSAREVISPNVCRIFDLVVLDQEELISMEYIDGITLLDLLGESGPLELKKARDIAAQFLAGLEAIHQAGLVHRDLKPENIMITRTGRVVVMDFGISLRVAQMSGAVAGTLPYMSPELLSGSNVDGRSDIFAAGVVLSEMIHTKGILSEKSRTMIWHALRVDSKRVPDSPWKSVITRSVAVNREDRFQNVGELIRALEEVTQRADGIDEQRPYPGLAPFSSSDAEYFFGRELEVETVIKKMQQFLMLAIIGPSGAGKTSFLRAGLLPALPNDWCIVFTSPGDSPILNLAQSLTRSIGNPNQFEDPEGAVGTFLRLRQSYKEIVLVIDRFEEVFTLNASAIQARYAEIIGRLSLEANVRIILAMRDDFLMLCRDHDSLRPVFSELTPLPSLTGPALRRALVQPALKCGYRFEDEKMVDAILADVQNERGALPLIAFAASRLWEKRDRKNGLLTRQAYKEIGGVSGALAQYAEKILEQMSEEKQSIVREIFRNLVTAQNTRAARDWDDLLSVIPDRNVAEEVLRTLVDARLLTSFDAPSGDGSSARRRVEIIHESLLSAWPRLVRWQTQDADSAQMRDQIRQASQVWEQRGRSEDLLWTGAAFLEYQLWRQRYPGGLTITEQEFAQAMARRASKRRRRRQAVSATIIVVLLAFLSAMTMLWRNASSARDRAVQQSQRAEAGRVMAIARSLDLDPSLKLAYALRSLEFADNPQARAFALQAMFEGPAYHAIGTEAFGIAMSPDGNWIVAGGSGGSVRLIPEDGSQPIMVNEADSPAPLHLPWPSHFSPDNEFLVYTWRKHLSVIKVWSMSQKKIVRTINFEGMTIPFLRNGKVFFVTDDSRKTDSEFYWADSTVRVWNFGPEEPQVLGQVNLQGGYWKTFDIDYEGRWIGYPKGNEVFIEELQTLGKTPARLIGGHTAKAHIVRFRPNAEEMASSDEKGEIRLWSLDPASKQNQPLRVITGKGEPLFNMWFDAAGDSLMAPRQGLVFRWDLTAPEEADPLSWRGQVAGGSFDKEHRWLIMGNAGGIWMYHDLPFQAYTFHGLAPSQGSSSVRFTPDGKSWICGFTADGISIHSMYGEKLPYRQLWNDTFWESDSLDMDPLGRYAVAATNGSGVHLISLHEARNIQLKGLAPFQQYSSVTFSPDGKSVAAVNRDGGIEIWDIAKGSSRILEHSESEGRIKYSPDGTLFSGDEKGNLRRWDLRKDAAEIVGRTGNHGGIASIGVSRGGRMVATVAWSGNYSELRLYDLGTGKSSVIQSHGNRVSCVAFDPQGRKLVTGDADGAVRVGPVTGETSNLLLGHESRVVDVLVHPNGKWILSSEGGHPTVKLWRMPDGPVQRLETLSASEFQNAIREMTNVRVVADESLPGGYRTQLAPFTGWRKNGEDHANHEK